MTKEAKQLTVTTGTILFIIITLARSTSFLMSKQMLVTMEPLNLLGIRFLMAFLILFVAFLPRVLRSIKDNPQILKAALVLGAINFFTMTAELLGLRQTSSSACAFLENTAIVMVPIAEAILLRKKPTPIIIVSALITMTGIGFLALPGGTGLSLGAGETLCIIAAVLYTGAIIATDRLSKRYDPLSLRIIYVGITGVMAMITSFVTETPTLPTNEIQWGLLLGLALLCTCVGFSLQTVAQRPLSAERVSQLCALNPLGATFFGWIILGEKLELLGVIGAALILAGILCSSKSMRTTETDTDAPDTALDSTKRRQSSTDSCRPAS